MDSRRSRRRQGKGLFLLEEDEVALERVWLIFQEECLQVQILFNNEE